MQHKVTKFSIADLALDYELVAKSLNRHCHNGQYRVSGMCQTETSVFFSLEINFEAPRQYVLAPFTACSDADVLADLHTRWHSGFSTRGLIRLSESYLGLFEIPVDVVDLNPETCTELDEAADVTGSPDSFPAE